MMIADDAFPVEPWHVRETELRTDLLPQTESLFALSNGHIGLRGNLDEGEPYGLPGTYLNGFYEIRPLPYAESGFGYPEDGQSIVNVTNGKIIRLIVEDEPFDVRYGELLSHERFLDMRAGTLTRHAEWRSPAGKQVRVESTRLVSLAQRGLAAIEYVVQAVDDGMRITVQSELVANEDQPETSGDPRVAAVLRNPLEPLLHEVDENGALLIHRTRSSALTMSAAMYHEVEAPGRVTVSGDAGRIGPGRRWCVRSKPVSDSASSSISPTPGRACGPDRRCAIRPPQPSRGHATPGGTACWTFSENASTSSGTVRMSRSTVTPIASRRSGSGSSTCSRPARERSSEPSPEKD